MYIRNITEEEKIYTDKIELIAFTETESNCTNLKQKSFKNIKAVFNTENKICSCITVLPKKIMFNGHIVPMAAISKAATLPEEKNRGYMRELLKHSMYEMKESGQLFSYLYPFSHIYYRKFGYEFSLSYDNTIIPASEFNFDRLGALRFYNEKRDFDTLNDIYLSFIKDKNLAVVRDNESWEYLISQNPYESNQYTYIWENENGEALSYIIYVDEYRKNNSISIKEFVWKNYEGFRGLMSNITNLTGRSSKVKWNVPNCIDILTLFEEPNKIEVIKTKSGMNRIIDVNEVLKLITPPQNKGSIIIKIIDDFLAFNNETYCLEWENNNTNVEKTSKKENLSISVQNLSQIITGFISPQQMLYKKNVTIKEQYMNILNQLFYRKSLFITDFF